MSRNYAIISPVRNEEQYLQRTIDSVLQQRCRPAEWIIVDDGSRDNTPRLVEKAASQHPWIRLIRRNDRGSREPGRGVVEAFNEGLSRLSRPNVDYLSKMDGDLEFGPEYFETLLGEFEANPRLGMASGNTYIRKPSGRVILEKAAAGFVVGPIKLYRRSCFEEIGGLEPHLGWDSIDVYRARMRGWQTLNHPALKVLHLRQMGTAKGIVWGKMKTGLGDHYMGTHPLFLLARCLYRMSDRPFLVNGLAIGAGYLKGVLQGQKRIADPELIAFLRAEQRARMLQLLRPRRQSVVTGM